MEGEASLRIVLLVVGHAAVRVHELDRVTIGAIREGGLIAGDTLVSKGLEDLLEGRLSDAVLLNAEVSLFVLKLPEEPSNRLVLLWDSQLEVLSALLENFDLLEVAREENHDAEAVSLSLQVFKQVSESHFALLVETCLNSQVVAKSIASDLIQNESIELGALELLNGSLKRDLRLRVALEAKAAGQILEVLVACLLHLDLDFVADAELVLDVLGAAHAAEDTATDHNSEFGRQCLSLLH